MAGMRGRSRTMFEGGIHTRKVRALSMRLAITSNLLTSPPNGWCRLMSQRSSNAYGTLPTLAMLCRSSRAERRVEEVRQVAQEFHGREWSVAFDHSYYIQAVSL